MAVNLIVSKSGNEYKLLCRIFKRVESKKAVMARDGIWVPKSQSFIRDEYQGCGQTNSYLYVREWIYNGLVEKLKIREDKRFLNTCFSDIQKGLNRIQDHLEYNEFSSRPFKGIHKKIKYFFEDLRSYLDTRDEL